MIAVEVTTEEGVQHVLTEAKIVIHHVGENLTSHFRMGYIAPMCEGPIFDNVGFLGDTAAACEILEGTYTFPPGTDIFTILLLQGEASRIFTTTTLHSIAPMVTMDDFQHLWHKSDVSIQLSKSGLHFDHYEAISFNDNLSALQVLAKSKFNLAIASGKPLQRWRNGVTVLLEKVLLRNSMRFACFKPISIDLHNRFSLVE